MRAALTFARRLGELTSRVLGEDLLSFIVHGSLTFDAYVPGQSDIDLLAITDRSLSDSEIESLVETVAAERTRAPAPADLRFATRAVAAMPDEAPFLDLYIRLRTTAPPEVEVRRREPDLLVELSVCRQHGHALLGADPGQLIGAVPPELVLRAGDAQLARWQSLTDDEPYAALMVLTACRIWRFGEERIHCSKSAAGAWALTRDPSLHAVRDALRQRAGEPVTIDPAEIARLLALVRERIAAGARGRPGRPARSDQTRSAPSCQTAPAGFHTIPSTSPASNGPKSAAAVP
jgi:predicted nucleotidyltransferase